MIDVNELAGLVRDMRLAQVEFFRARREGRPGAVELVAARELERRVDAVVQTILNGSTIVDKEAVP